MFIICYDDLLLQTDVSPSNKLMDRSRTEGETVSTCDDEMLPLIDVRPSNKLMERSRTEGENVSTFR